MNPKHDGQFWIARSVGQLRRVDIQKEAILVALECVQQHIPVWANRALPQRITNAFPRSLRQRRPESSTTHRRLAISDATETVIEIPCSRLVDLMATPQYATRSQQQHSAFVLAGGGKSDVTRGKSRSSENVSEYAVYCCRNCEDLLTRNFPTTSRTTSMVLRTKALWVCPDANLCHTPVSCKMMNG